MYFAGVFLGLVSSERSEPGGGKSSLRHGAPKLTSSARGQVVEIVI